jgi:hypothetical protein
MSHVRISFKDVATDDPIAPPDVVQSGNLVLGAPPALPDPANPQNHYVFLFWSVPGHSITKTNPLDVHAHRGSEVTAWYGLTGGHGIRTLAFSDGKNKVLAETPIASVDPAAAWTGGNSKEVSNQTEVAITAKGSIVGDTGEAFDGWLQFENGIVSGPTLTVPAGGDCFALASYRHHKIKQPETNDLSYVTLFVGIKNGDGGIEQYPNGKIVVVHPDPQPWVSMAPADQDLLLGLSLNEIGSLVNDTVAGSAIRKTGLDLAGEALKKLAATAAKE